MSELHSVQGIVLPVKIDFEEGTPAVETIGQLAGISFALEAGLSSPYFTFSEALETTTGVDDADALVVEFPDGQERWVDLHMATVAVDAGIGAVEAEDFFDVGIAVNGTVVAESTEGASDAADTVGPFTRDCRIRLEDGDIVNFVVISKGDEDEEFTVTIEAGEGDIVIA